MPESSSARPHFGRWAITAAHKNEANPRQRRQIKRAVWAAQVLVAEIQAIRIRKSRRNTEDNLIALPTDDTLAVLRRVVFEVLCEEYSERTVLLPESGNSICGHTDPLAAAGVAKDLMVPLRELVAEFVRTARGQGRSWLSVAHALGFGEEEWSPEYAAFGYVASAPEHSDNRMSLGVSSRPPQRSFCSTSIV